MKDMKLDRDDLLLFLIVGGGLIAVSGFFGKDIALATVVSVVGNILLVAVLALAGIPEAEEPTQKTAPRSSAMANHQPLTTSAINNSPAAYAANKPADSATPMANGTA